MLQADCDIAATKDFERNFDSTYIGEHKTPLANTFRVMHLDFSGIDADIFTEGFVANDRDGPLDFSLRNNFKEGTDLLQGHYRSLSLLLTDFLFVYKQYFTDSIYLAVDEYDQGADEVLAMNIESFRDLTRSGGILKTFYSKIKDFAAKAPLHAFSSPALRQFSSTRWFRGFPLRRFSRQMPNSQLCSVLRRQNFATGSLNSLT